MRCSKCGRNLGLIAKFCPKCGTEVTAKQKKKSLIFSAAWLLGFLTLIPLFYYIYTEMDVANLADYGRLTALAVAAFTAFFAFCIFYMVYFILSSIIRFVIRQPIIGSIVVVAFLGLIGFGFYLYFADLKSERFFTALVLLQDNLTETTVAKIMGDSLVAKKPLANASWERVSLETQMVAGRLKSLKVPKELESYKQAAIAWNDDVGIATLKPKVWENVAKDPGAFELKLSNQEAKQLFKKTTEKIAELKEFSDNAIRVDNKPAMVYIAAKLRVQRHWLTGLLYSEKAGLFAVNLIAPAYASSAWPGVPEVGPGRDVTCDLCHTLTTMTESQRRQYNCDTRCNPATRKTPQPPSNQQTQGGQTGNLTNQQNKNNTNVSQGSGPGSSLPPGRQICLGRGGTGSGQVTAGGTPGNVYCVQEVVQLTSGLDASAIGFVQGKSDWEKDWNDYWHNLEGLGVISIGEPTSAENSPTVQEFYDQCKDIGGTVGGAGMTKGRLPTTEFGYTCNYKINNKGCWDFLTYSGGRYAGGQAGCPEINLLPNTDEQQAKAGIAGKWDGHYVGTIAANCTTDIPGLSTYSPKQPGDFLVTNNVINDSDMFYVAIDESGNAIEPIQLTISVENINAYLDAIFYHHFIQKNDGAAMSSSGSIDLHITAQNRVFYGSCKSTGSAVRQ